ncbi:MAG: N-acetylmuramoyl-L-alanine amidase [Syntrophorhabdales bacterium]|jgi:N-acetylmuramoyl-L-alanine amidase
MKSLPLLCPVLLCLLLPLRATAGAGLPRAPGGFVVAIDAGHSRESPGAVSSRGVPEYDFNTKLAVLLLERLHDRGFQRAFIISGKDQRALSPVERAEAANRAGADLLISIHHDSVQPCYLSRWTYGGKALLYSDRFAGYSLFLAGCGENYRKSLLFATMVAGRMAVQGFRPSCHHGEAIPGEGRDIVDAGKGIYRDKGLVLLREARMAAVLIEGGVIVNRGEEEMLKTPECREKIVEAIVSSVEEYSSRVPEGGHN